ncbi:MAG TPA: hypothetical protein VNT60_07865, partial [Deinococcales bacterium]|nr:hypothetical protein [Deinococcales bacterium]
AITLPAALAQSLRSEPWPPTGQEFDLVGSGFAPGERLDLSFDGAVTMPEGAPAPASLIADARGAFRLPLRASGSLEVVATSPTQTARLALALPQQAPPAAPAARAAAPEPPDVRLEGGILSARRGDRFVWRVTLPASTVGPVLLDGSVSTGEGNTVVTRAANSGRVLRRQFLSGPVTALDASGGDLRATVTHEGGASEVFTVRGSSVVERVVFPPSPVLLATLEDGVRAGLPANPFAAASAAEVEARLAPRAAGDPLNPILLVYLGAARQQLGRQSEAAALYRQALDAPAPFYARIRTAALLERAGQPALADEALSAARATWAAAGHDPGFRVSQAAMERWGDPLGTARRLFASGQALRGGAWLAFLRSTMPRFEGYERVYGEYAAWLDAQGRGGEAQDWRGFAGGLASSEPYGLGEHGLRALSGVAFIAVLTLFGSYLALWLALAAKYWRAQAADLRPFGGRVFGWARSPLVRARFMLAAYHTVTEKLVLLTVLVLAAGALGAWTWSLRGITAMRDPVLNAGTLGGPAYWNGLAAQLDRDPGRAEQFYRQAPGIAAAQNNLGVLLAARGDQAEAGSLFSRALSLDRNEQAAAHNLGLGPGGYRVAFHNAYAPASPMLSVPDPASLLHHTVGGVDGEYRRAFRDPWAYLTTLPLNVPAWARTVIAVAGLVVLGLAVLAFLLVRPRSARHERGGFLGAAAALLVPGSSLADEVWGLLLLIPWAATVTGIVLAVALPTGAAPQLLAPASPLGLVELPPLVDLAAVLPILWAVLAALYLINALAWALESAAARRRVAPTAAPNP